MLQRGFVRRRTASYPLINQNFEFSKLQTDPDKLLHFQNFGTCPAESHKSIEKPTSRISELGRFFSHKTDHASIPDFRVVTDGKNHFCVWRSVEKLFPVHISRDVLVRFKFQNYSESLLIPVFKPWNPCLLYSAITFRIEHLPLTYSTQTSERNSTVST